MQLLIIGSVWPEPNSSAAGENMMAIIHQACQRNWSVTFCSASQRSIHAIDLSEIGVEQVDVALNCSSFDRFVYALQPDIVIFDRFMVEEQFSWRVARTVPHAMRVLNTEDLHGLRAQRQAANSRSAAAKRKAEDVKIRELAAILRSDVTLVISQTEYQFLSQGCGIPERQLQRFSLKPPPQIAPTLSFESRSNISFIGNFKHEPNWDAVLYLYALWPKIRAKLPDCECHIYGAYPPPKATRLTNKKTGFMVKGWIANPNDAFASYRLSVAPLRFGAGIKGKLLRSLACGTPSVTTSIGIEGIAAKEHWPGIVADNDEDIITAICNLYINQNLWQNAFDLCVRRYKLLADVNDDHDCAFKRLESIVSDINPHRQPLVLRQILNHQTLGAQKFMSQWIEAKNN